MSAILKRNKSLVKKLLEKEDLQATNSQLRTALHYAVESGDEGLVEVLLKKKAAVDASDASGYTPLLLAAESCNRKICEMLLKAGANVGACTALGQTALHLVLSSSKFDLKEGPKLVKLLLEKGKNKLDINKVRVTLSLPDTKICKNVSAHSGASS
jgi:ankyrin repeat protein